MALRDGAAVRIRLATAMKGSRVAKLSISQAWDESRAVLARDGKLFASLGLALIVLPQTIAGLVAPYSVNDVTPLTWWVAGFAILIGFAAQIAINRLAIGPSTTVGAAITRGFGRMPVFLLALLLWVVVLVGILILLAMILGAAGLIASPGAGHEPPASMIVLMFVLALVTYAIFQLTVPVAAVEDGGPIHLILRSWTLGRGAYWRLLAFAVLLLVCLVITYLAGQFVIGGAIAALLGPPAPWNVSALTISLVLSAIQAGLSIIFGVMLARIYKQLPGNGGHGVRPSVPSSGT